MEKRLKLESERETRVESTTRRIMQEFEQRIVASPPGVCPVDLQLAFLKVCHAQTCGKCVPCRIGLGQLENLLEDVLANRATMETLDLIKETARIIRPVLLISHISVSMVVAQQLQHCVYTHLMPNSSK